MSQSVKLSNGNYIDAEGVWDATSGMAQSNLNNHLNKYIYIRGGMNSSASVSSFNIYFQMPAPMLLVVDNGSYANAYIVSRLGGVKALAEGKTGFTPTITTNSDGSYNIKVPVQQWSKWFLITTIIEPIITY